MIAMAQTPRKAKFKTSVPLPTYDELERPDPNSSGLSRRQCGCCLWLSTHNRNERLPPVSRRRPTRLR